ncbi:6-hydroxy-D-nicotine oxidase [Rhypophila decipiens]|uniref:6-hydroxy-D-nicotine oxidase n=1 Tax=Rhypophila decipiens TaxID=261697 RepID=A0AAN6YBR8_9PEZI|nr:6-hydroxy-D-nicotine oxidase [Rhypophila decipiens]
MHPATLLVAAQALLQGAEAGKPGKPFECCTRLSSALPNRVFLAGSSSYLDLNSHRWSNTTILSPSCIVTPETAQEVSLVVRTLTKGSGCSFAVKSGGHNSNPRFNNIDNGVTVDLKRLNTARLSADKSYVTLGAGTNMGQAYAAVANTGYAFPGGICDGVGVGGIATGGGQSFFMPKVGWVVDNVLKYEVVIASGQVVTASKNIRPDLYKALKGGATNFGIVTKVDIAAFPHDGFWGGQLIVPATKLTNTQVLERVSNFTALNNEHVDAAIMIMGLYGHDGHRIVDIGLASTDNTSNPEVLAPFFDVGPKILNTVGHKSLVNFVHEVTQPMPDGLRVQTATLTVKNDLETLKRIQGITDSIYEQIKGQVPNLDWMFSYNPQPKVLTTHAATRGGNSLGLEGADHDSILWWLVPRWTDAASDAIVHAAVKSWVDQVQQVANELGTADPFIYNNHAAYFQKPMCGYGTETLKFLRAVSKKYDPHQVFQKLVPGGHKVSTKC